MICEHAHCNEPAQLLVCLFEEGKYETRLCHFHFAMADLRREAKGNETIVNTAHNLVWHWAQVERIKREIKHCPDPEDTNERHDRYCPACALYVTA